MAALLVLMLSRKVHHIYIEIPHLIITPFLIHFIDYSLNRRGAFWWYQEGHMGFHQYCGYQDDWSSKEESYLQVHWICCPRDGDSRWKSWLREHLRNSHEISRIALNKNSIFKYLENPLDLKSSFFLFSERRSKASRSRSRHACLPLEEYRINYRRHGVPSPQQSRYYLRWKNQIGRKLFFLLLRL